MDYSPYPERYSAISFNRCGKSGVMLSPLSLGFWHNFGDYNARDNALAMVQTAFDHGITHFDLANNYGPPPGSAEECMGWILHRSLLPYRDELFISTKAGHFMWPGPYGDGGSRKNLLASLDQSLKRLRLDYVDLFYIHRYDPETPVEETASALAHAVHSGKALYVGISKFPQEAARAIYRILSDMHIHVLAHQFRYNIWVRQAEQDQIPSLREMGLGGIAFSPLAQGMLSDKYLHGIPVDSRAAGPSCFLKREHVEEKSHQIQQLDVLAHERGQTLAQMALSWVLRRPEITTCLIGASRPQQIIDCLPALQHISWSQEELDKIDHIVGIRAPFS